MLVCGLLVVEEMSSGMVGLCFLFP